MNIRKISLGVIVVLAGVVSAFASSKANYRQTYFYNTPTLSDKCTQITYNFACTNAGSTCVGVGGAANGQQLYQSDGATECVTPLQKDI